MSRALALARLEWRILRNDLFPVLIVVVIPIGCMSIFQNSMAGALTAAGYQGVSGAEQVVPGFWVLSALFLPAFIGMAFVRDHGWFTWDRIRSTELREWEIVVGKVLPWLVLGAVHAALVLTGGVLLFGLDSRGSLLALVPLVASATLFVTAFGLVLVTFATSMQQMNAFALMGSIAFAGIGGALTPREAQPSGVQAIAPASPTYWMMRGFRSVVLDGGGFASTLLPVAVLGGAAAVCTVVSLLRLRFDEVKISVV